MSASLFEYSERSSVAVGPGVRLSCLATNSRTSAVISGRLIPRSESRPSMMAALE